MTRSQNRYLFVYFLFDRRDPFAERRMAVFKNDVDLGGREVREVFACKLFERGDHCGTVALGNRLSVRAVFGEAAVGVHDDRGQRHNNAEHYAHNYVSEAVVDISKSERGVKLGKAYRNARGSADDEHIEEIEDLTLEYVLVKTVTELVREDGAYFIGRHSVYKIVEKDDRFHLAEAREVCVELCRAARCVHNLDRLDLVAVLGQKIHKVILELTLLQRRKFISYAAEDRVEERYEEAEREHRTGENRDHPDAEQIIGKADQFYKEERQHESEQERADAVADKGFDARTVEAVFLLDDHIGNIAFDNSRECADDGLEQDDGDQLPGHVIGEETRESRVRIGKEDREHNDARDNG